jgi:hypothetical protein
LLKQLANLRLPHYAHAWLYRRVNAERGAVAMAGQSFRMHAIAVMGSLLCLGVVFSGFDSLLGFWRDAPRVCVVSIAQPK